MKFFKKMLTICQNLIYSAKYTKKIFFNLFQPIKVKLFSKIFFFFFFLKIYKI